MSSVYLVTGATRGMCLAGRPVMQDACVNASDTLLILVMAIGLGLGFVSTYASRPNHTVIAAVRESSSASSKALSSLPTGSGSKIVTVKIDSKSETDAAAAAQAVEAAGVNHVDVVIANAGISTDYSCVDQVPLDVLREHVDVNAYGPLILYKAFYPLLIKSKAPKFVALGSPLGSLTGMDQRPYPCAAYGPSKAILHWFVRKISFENPEITSLILDPG